MFKAIANYIVDQKIKAQSSKIKKAFVQLENIESIAILAHHSDLNNVALKKFIYEIDKKVDIVVVHNDKLTKNNEAFLSLNKKDLNFLQIPNANVLERIASKQFDVLVDCCLAGEIAFKCLSGLASTECKVGSGDLSYNHLRS